MAFGIFGQAFLSRAAYYGMKGRYSKGIMSCNEAIKLQPRSVRAYLYRFGSLSCSLLLYSILPTVSYTTGVKSAVSTLSLVWIKSILANVYTYAIGCFASFYPFLGAFRGGRSPFTFLQIWRQLHVSDLAEERERQLMTKNYAERTEPYSRFPNLCSAIGNAGLEICKCRCNCRGVVSLHVINYLTDSVLVHFLAISQSPVP